MVERGQKRFNDFDAKARAGGACDDEKRPGN